MQTMKTNSLPLSWNIAKILQACYYRNFEYALPCPPQTLILSIFKESRKWGITLLEILHFSESCSLTDWLTLFWLINWEPEFCQRWGLRWNKNSYIIFHFRLFPGETNDKSFQKTPKQNTIFGLFYPFWGKRAFSSKFCS